MPESNPVYQTSIQVRVDDMNYGNHMGNDRYLAFAHEARLQFLRSHQQSELNFFEASLIMADSAIMYRGEAFNWRQHKRPNISREYSFVWV